MKKGEKMSRELRLKLSLIKKGIPMSEEQKKKLSIVLKGKNLGNTWGFKKGKPSLFKGKKHSFATRQKIINALKDRKLTEEHKRKIGIGNKHPRLKHWKLSEEHKKKMSERMKGINTWTKGIKMSKETKDKISKANKGEKSYMFGKKKTEETKSKISKSKKGISTYKGAHWKLSEESRRKISEAQKGEKCHWWKGGITPINKAIRSSLEYKLWREAVFRRDKWTCVWCGYNKGGILNADHIKPFAYYPELRFAIDNGRTLCIHCHRKTDTYGAKNNKKQSTTF